MTLIVRQNQKGGPCLKNFPLEVDEKTSCLGYKIGYCEHCNDPLLIRTIDLNDVLNRFGVVDNSEPKKPIRVRIGEYLLKSKI